jgi:hypothetical protein
MPSLVTLFRYLQDSTVDLKIRVLQVSRNGVRERAREAVKPSFEVGIPYFLTV